jgi:hypothetical protein
MILYLARQLSPTISIMFNSLNDVRAKLVQDTRRTVLNQPLASQQLFANKCMTNRNYTDRKFGGKEMTLEGKMPRDDEVNQLLLQRILDYQRITTLMDRFSYTPALSQE